MTKTTDEYENSPLPSPKTKGLGAAGTHADRGDKGGEDEGPHMPASAMHGTEREPGGAAFSGGNAANMRHAVRHLESMPHGHRTKV